MIYYFSYRHGEIMAEVHADCELEAWMRLLDSSTIIEVNLEMLNPDAWELGDTEEEYDQQ